MKCDYVNLGNTISGHRHPNPCQLPREGIFGTATTFIMFPLGMAISIHFCHIEKINFPVVDGRVSVANVLDHL